MGLYNLKSLYNNKTFIAQSNFCILLFKFIITSSLVIKEYTTYEVNLWYSTTTIFSLLLVLPNLTMGSFVRFITYTLNQKKITIFKNEKEIELKVKLKSIKKIIDIFYFSMLIITTALCVTFIYFKIFSDLNIEKKEIYCFSFTLISIVAVYCHKYKCLMYSYKFVESAIRIELLINLVIMIIVTSMFAMKFELYLILLTNISSIAIVYLIYLVFYRRYISGFRQNEKSKIDVNIINSIIRSASSNFLNNLCLNIIPLILTFSHASIQTNMFLFMNRIIQTISKSSNLFFSPYIPELTNLISKNQFPKLKKIVFKIISRITVFLFAVFVAISFVSNFKNTYNPIDSQYFNLYIFLFAFMLMFMDRIYNLAISLIYCSNNICFISNLTISLIVIIICYYLYPFTSLYVLFAFQYVIKIIFLGFKPFRLIHLNYNLNFFPLNKLKYD